MKIEQAKQTFSPITITIESNSELLALLAAANVNQSAVNDDLFSGMRFTPDNRKNLAGKASREFSNKIFDGFVPKTGGSNLFNWLVCELIRKIEAGE